MSDTETFREWFERTREMPYPTHGGEEFRVVTKRIGDAIADWADVIAERAVGKKP